MTPFEWLAVAYFAVLAVAAPRTAARRRGLVYAAGAVVLVIVARFVLPWPLRAWLPVVYLVLGYWIPAAFVSGTNYEFERWLARADARLGWGEARVRYVPDTILELSYLLCYPLVPAAFAIVFAWGTRTEVERFWLAVLIAGYACYVTLPWLSARPPRLAAGRTIEPAGIARVNALLLGRVSHRLVTFPSGHVAVSLAAALAAAPVWPAAGGVLTMVALMIAVAAVSGRYHYLVDVVLGLLVGAVGPLVTGLAG